MQKYVWMRMTTGTRVPVLVLATVIAACVTDRPDTVDCPSGFECPAGWQCTETSDIGTRDIGCYPTGCGDGVLARSNGEVCDDANNLDGDGCNATCLVLERCGDGKLDPGEPCDPSVAGSTERCTETCQIPHDCGNGTVNPEEQCDDGENGNSRDTLDCDADCTEPLCGDGHHNPLVEECDDSANTNTCDADCSLPMCGDGLLNTLAGEECDDGNNIDVDVCPSGSKGECKLARCGDGVIFLGIEQCDDGNARLDDVCPDGDEGTCRPAHCGDGFINSLEEDCDPGQQDNSECDSDCTPVECGDGRLNAAAGESCDDGNRNDRDGCPDGFVGNCQLAYCGDGLVHAGVEDCEPIESNLADCDTDCTRPECGDGIWNEAAGEHCDDGNAFFFDDCVVCEQARCGDGYIQLGVEQCDDGNANVNDQCPTPEELPADGEIFCRPAICGDGFELTGLEECDHAGESEFCDADCTYVECGDGYQNSMAEEECGDDDDCESSTRCREDPADNRCKCI
jgi:cysteine-rich repeat protein